MAIDCALCFRDDSGTYFINAYVTILSIFENTKEKINIHIIHDDTIEHGKKHLEELCDKYGNAIYFHKAPDKYFDEKDTYAITRRYNIGAVYLYYIHEFIDADKAVYLDCDIIVNRDIAELYNMPLGERIVAGTRNWGRYWKNGKAQKRYRETIGYLRLREESYVNSGLLLMNLKRLRELSGESNIFVQKTLAAGRDGIVLHYPDMDILNSVAAMVPDGVLPLDHSFNLWHNALHLGIQELEGTIFHYITKPTSSLYPAHLLFWKYYAMTPFAGDMFERMARAYGSMAFVREYATRPRHRRHAEEVLRHGIAGMLLKSAARALGIGKK